MIRRLFNEVFKAAESHMIQRVTLACTKPARADKRSRKAECRARAGFPRPSINTECLPLVRGDKSASASTGRIIPVSAPRKRG